MFDERKVNVCEGVPLNSTSAGAANIFLNSGRNTNPKSDGTVIHLNTEKPAEVGVHINTTLSIASSKKIKLLFILNFLLSVLCMVISSSIAFYYWNEMISMRRQLDSVRDQVLLYQNVKDGHLDNIQQSALMSVRSPYRPEREPRMDPSVQEPSKPKKYYVEDLGDDMLLVDLSKKADKTDTPVLGLPVLQKELLVAHFNGGTKEINLGSKVVIGPWERDVNVSSKGSESRIELHPDQDYVIVKESGLYLVYAQIVYLSRAANCFYVWARAAGGPRLLAACAGPGHGAAHTSLDQAQMSCSVQTVTRLSAGDTVNLSQREQNQVLWLRPGYSYFGFIKLSS